MGIRIDAASPESPFAQLRDQIRGQVLSGELEPGTRLPTVRGLATDLGLATNTVARAYRELEGLGVIETRGRAGSFVSGEGVERAAREATHAYVEQLRSLGVERDRAIALVRRAYGG
jgi:DNA-binding transcriptional regulator YhcF (GntR family)